MHTPTFIRSVLSFILLAVQCSLAAEHLVTSSTEVNRLAKTLAAGDTLVIKDGVWQGAEWLINAHGTESKPIIIRPETPGGATLRGRVHIRIGGEHLHLADLRIEEPEPSSDAVIELRATSKLEASSCRVTGCSITDNRPPQKKAPTAPWISLYGRSNRVDHCYLSGKINPAATLIVWIGDAPNHHRIDRNHFGPRKPLGANGGETIRIGDSAHSMESSCTIVEENLFTACNGEVEIISNKSCDNIYRRNTFRACEGAMTLRHGNRCRVEGNFFLGEGKPRTGGVRVIGEDHVVLNNYFEKLAGSGSRSALSLMNGLVDTPLHGYFQVRRPVIAFNTFIDCPSGLLIGYGGDASPKATLPPKDGHFLNNLVVRCGSQPVRIETMPLNFQWLGNVSDSSPNIDGFRIEPVNWIKTDDHRLVPRSGDGLFADRMPPGVNTPSEDIAGKPRPARASVGSDDTVNSPVRYKPLLPADTGPCWLTQRSP